MYLRFPNLNGHDEEGIIWGAVIHCNQGHHMIDMIHVGSSFAISIFFW